MRGLGRCRGLLGVVRMLLGGVRMLLKEREKEVEERKKTVERRERRVREREGKAEELEQENDKRERAPDQRGSEIEEHSRQIEELEEEMEVRSAQHGCLNVSTLVVGSNSWPIALGFVVFRVLGYKTSSLLFFSCPPSSSKPSSSSNTDSSTATPSPSSLSPLKEDPDMIGKTDTIYTSQMVDGEYPVLVGINVCAVVLKVLVRRLIGVGM